MSTADDDGDAAVDVRTPAASKPAPRRAADEPVPGLLKTRVAVYKGLGGYGTLGLEMVLSVMIGLFGGRWLDGRFGTDPWLMWIGFGFGIGAAVRAIQRALVLMRREAAREEKLEGNPEPLYVTDRERGERSKDKAWQEDAAKARARTEDEA